MNTQSIRIYICDDHQIVIEGLILLLQDVDKVSVVGSGKNGKEALAWLKKNKADIILMDINMPQMDGIEACTNIAEKYPNVHVIFLSMINEIDLMGTLRSSGAKGYLLKNSGKDELLEAIRLVNQGDMYFDENVIEVESKKVIEQSLPKISKREKEVLSLIVEEYTSPEIAEKLFISLGTVQTHRKNLLSKLGVKNTAGLVRFAFQYGLFEK